MKRRLHPPSVSSQTLRAPRRDFFWFLVLASFVGLFGYRVFFQLPVWFDEIFAKAVLFGLPVLVYALTTKQSITLFGLQPKKFWTGAYLGLAIGGSFGFVAMFASSIQHHGHVLIPYIFASPIFWWTFFLAFVTAWWESLFFYGFILSVLQKMNRGNEWSASIWTTVLFLVFHAPILVLRGGVGNSILPLLLLGLFALGQSIIFLRFKSLTAMVVSHAFWGMALLVYTLK